MKHQFPSLLLKVDRVNRDTKFNISAWMKGLVLRLSTTVYCGIFTNIFYPTSVTHLPDTNDIRI
jgi:hypothetical protein